MNDWQTTPDYSTMWRETDDPRVLEIIVRDEYAREPWSDALCPAYYIDWTGDHYRAERAGEVFHDDESDGVAQLWADARTRFRYAAGYRYNGLSTDMIVRSEVMLRRYMRVFHDTRYYVVDRADGMTLLLLDTPGYRKNVGSPSRAYLFEGGIEEWRAYLDGDVWGVGHAINPDRKAGEPIDPNASDWQQEIECWGFYGEGYAKGSLQDFEMPDLAEYGA